MILSFELEIILTSCMKTETLLKLPEYETHHAVYLWFAPLCQVDDIDSVVVEVFHAAVEVLPQKGAGFTGQRDASKTQLWRQNRGRHLSTRYRNQFTTVKLKIWCLRPSRCVYGIKQKRPLCSSSTLVNTNFILLSFSPNKGVRVGDKKLLGCQCYSRWERPVFY